MLDIISLQLRSVEIYLETSASSLDQCFSLCTIFLDNDGLHYKPFEDLYGKSTTEQHRPSLDSKHRKSHGIPFSSSAPTARTVSHTVMCSECLRPRVMYAQKKLSFQEGLQLERILQDVYFTCGSSLQDIDSRPWSWQHYRFTR